MNLSVPVPYRLRTRSAARPYPFRPSRARGTSRHFKARHVRARHDTPIQPFNCWPLSSNCPYRAEAAE